jgi:hypothetical protein
MRQSFCNAKKRFIVEPGLLKLVRFRLAKAKKETPTMATVQGAGAQVT